ncbi:MAG: M16 family metallopeptidase [Planctomycetota bacterium]|jgi:zinc protease
MLSRMLSAVSAALVLGVVLSNAAAVRAELKQVTSVEGITEYRMDNGMQVLLFPDPSKPTVTVNVTYFVGSRHEGYGEAGMAHLLEHMLFKGTPTHEDIPQLLKDRGAELNGTTWLDRTNYYETLPASEDNLDFALKLEADRMVNSKVAAEDLQSEFSVVRNEFERGENSPVRVLWQRMVSAAFLWHNYGNSTIGNRADIERVPIDNLKRFYKRYYQPDNAMLVISGKFDAKQALELTEKYFGALPRPERKLDKTYTVEPAQDGERFVTLRRVGEVAAVGAVYHVPSGPHPEYAAVDVLGTMLTQEPAGRLYKALVETKKAAFVFGGPFALHDPGIMLIIAQVNQGNEPQVVLESLLDETEGIGESKITEQDVARARQELLKQWELSSANSQAIAIQLSEWAAQGDWRLYFLYRDRLEKVTVDEVRAAAKKYLVQNNRTAGVYIPTKEADRVSVPETPSLAEMIGDYKGRKAIAQGEAFDVSPDNIEARTNRLAPVDGFHIAFLPKKTRGETVDLQLTLRFGSEASLQDKSTLSEFLAPMMTRGTKEMSRQELKDSLDENLATLSGSSSAGSATFSIRTKREKLSTVIGYLIQVLRSPTFPAEELEIMKNEQLSALEEAKTSPQTLASREAQRRISPYPKGHPLYSPTIEEEIELVKAMTRDDLVSLHANYLNAQHGELSVVGDFDSQEVLKQLSAALAEWKSKESYSRIARRGDHDIKPESVAINTPDKANAMYFGATIFPLRDDHPDYPAMIIGNHILGGGALANRLGNRVRQKDGLSYGIRSSVSASSLDERAIFYIYAISNPTNMEKVKAAILEEVNLLRNKGVTQEELDAAKKGWLQNQEVARSRDSSLASTLRSTSHARRTMGYYSGLETKVRSTTVEQVNEVVRKYFDPKKLVIVTAGDFEKAAAGK